METPTNPPQLQKLVRSHKNLVATGGGSKSALSRAPKGSLQVSVAQLKGIVSYRPAELTLTAGAATSLQQIQGELDAQGQYLPFDELLRFSE